MKLEKLDCDEDAAPLVSLKELIKTFIYGARVSRELYDVSVP